MLGPGHSRRISAAVPAGLPAAGGREAGGFGAQAPQYLWQTAHRWVEGGAGSVLTCDPTRHGSNVN